MVLDLINDLKFHEEYMAKWKIYDLRIERSIKSLEIIYGKLLFNQQSAKLVALFDNLKKPTYYYFLEDKKLSYLLADALNTIKGQLTLIKNIRKDSAFKLSVVSFVRKALYFFFLNLEFLARDQKGKLELWAFPFLLNSFNELEVKFDGLMRYVFEAYKLNNKYLHQFFNKEYFRNWFARIRDELTATYKFTATQENYRYFQELDDLVQFPVNDFFESNIRKQIEVSSQFAANYSAVPEQCMLEGLYNDMFDLISRKYSTWADFPFDKVRERMAEVQGKILTLKLTDSLLKTKLVKITKSFEDYFLTDENAQINAFNITFAFDFRQDYHKVINIIQMKEFADRDRKRAVLKFITHSARDFKSFSDRRSESNRVFYKMRILRNLSKFVTKLVDTYNRRFGDPAKKSDEQEDAEPEEPAEGGEAGEEMKKPPELDEVVVPCRYFPYKKKTKQNFAYIKSKWGNQNKNFAVRRAVHLLEGRADDRVRQNRPQPAPPQPGAFQNHLPRKIRGPIHHFVLQGQHDVYFGVPERGGGRPVHAEADPPHRLPHLQTLRPPNVTSPASKSPTFFTPRKVSGSSTSTKTT